MEGRELTRCTRHGLAYDPAVQNGCTVCRREQSARPPPAEVIEGGAGGLLSRLFLLVLALGGCVGAYYGYKKWATSKAAPVGSSCTAEYGCVEGADCMSGGFGLERLGKCYRRCGTDDACAPYGQRCSSGHCMTAAPVNGACDGDVTCTEGAECVSLTGGGGPQCLMRCSFMMGATPDGCPDGTTCTRVMNGLMPTNPMFSSDYCVPSR